MATDPSRHDLPADAARCARAAARTGPSPRPRWRSLAAWAGLTGALAAGAATASVQNITTPGAWPQGRITWYYNPSGRPANLGDAEVIAAVEAAFAGWSRVCQVEGRYGGVTTELADPPPSGIYVVGWSDFGSPQFHARGSHRSTLTSGGYRPFTGGGVRINTATGDLRDMLDNGTFVGLMQHEIGHTLGLAHSDEPSSIMFANPYNPSRHEQVLQGDDIAACADLYGGRGVVEQPDQRDAAPVPGVPVQAIVSSTRPTLAIPGGSLTQIDPVAGGPYYFDSRWQGLAAGSTVQRQWVTPWGNAYQRSPVHVTTGASGFRFSTFPDDGYRFPFAGRWSFQVLVDGRLAASVPFEVLRGTVPAVAPFEAALVGERRAAGEIAWRVVPYGNGTPVATRVVANGRALASDSAAAQAGANLVEMWIETSRPRYKLDQSDGQPAHSLDVVRRAQFTASADGTPSAPGLQVIESGTPSAYTAQAAFGIDQSGEHGIWLVAVAGPRVFFRGASGWSERPQPLVSVRGPAVGLVDLLRNVDIRGLPAGAALYVGYGRTPEELLARGQYRRVRAF